MRCLIPLLLLAIALPQLARAEGPPPPNDPAEVIVRRGNGVVTFADLDGFMSEVPAAQRAELVASPERVEQILRNMLLAKQLAYEQRELEKTRPIDPVLAARLQWLETKTRAEFQAQTLRDQAPKVDVAALARESYQANPSLYATPETIDVRHVLVGLANRDEATAQALAAKVHALAVTPGQSFEALVAEYSDDAGTNAKGGLIEDATRDMLAPGFADAAFALDRPGAISPVVRTEFGFHVIELVARTPGVPRPFEAVQAELEAKVAAEHAGRWAQQHLTELSNMALDATPERVGAISDRYGEVPPKAKAAPQAPGGN